MPPLHEIAHLAHVELRTPVLDESVASSPATWASPRPAAAGDSVFLRAWDDYENTTIKLTAHATSGVGRTNLRAASPEALQRRVAAIESDRAGHRLAGRRPGLRADLRLHRPRRPRVRPVLRVRVVPAAGRAGAGR